MAMNVPSTVEISVAKMLTIKVLKIAFLNERFAKIFLYQSSVNPSKLETILLELMD